MKPKSDVIGRKERNAERDLKMLKMRQAGLNYREIGKQFGIAHTTAYRAVKRVMEEIKKETKETAKEHLEIDLLRLEDAVKAIYAKVLKGDLKAIDRLVNIIDKKSRILGYDHLTVSVMSEDDRAILDNLFGSINKEREEWSLETSAKKPESA